MDHIESNVTSKHKIVKVLTHPPNYSRDELLPDNDNVIIGRKEIVEDVSKLYMLQGGDLGECNVPIVMSFRNFWNGVFREYCVSALFRGIGSDYIKDDGKMFVVSAPPSITKFMNYSHVAVIEPQLPDISPFLIKRPRFGSSEKNSAQYF